MADGDTLQIVDGHQSFSPPLVTVTATRIISAETTQDDATVLAAEILTADVGSLVSGTAIPAGATIVSVVNGVSFELSDVATETLADIARVTEPAPGAGGANRLWRRGEADEAALYIRDATDSYWIAFGPGYYDANGSLYATIAAGAGGALVVTSFAPNGFSTHMVKVGLGGGLVLQQFDSAGSEGAQLLMSPAGDVEVTSTTFKWNGDQIAVVP